MKKTFILVMVTILLFHIVGHGHAESEENTMAVYREDIVTIELESGSIHRSFLSHTIGSGDALANWFGVRLFRNGEPVSVESASVTGFFIAPDGTRYVINETSYPGSTSKSGNVAEVRLPGVCYAVDGQFCLAIKLSSGSVEATMRIVDGVVSETGEAGAVVPTSTIPTTADIIAAYEEAVEVVAGAVRFDATQSLSDTGKATARGNIGAANIGSLAPEFSTGTAYSIGDYVTNDGKAYRFTTDHAAGAWNATHVTEVSIGTDVAELRGDFDEVVVPYVSKNILNPNGTFVGGYISPTDGSFTESSSYIASDYIQVEGDKYFVSSNTLDEYSEMRFIAEYDANKTIIPAPAQSQGEGDGTHYKTGYLLLDENCAYVRVSIASGRNKNAVMWELSESSTPSEFEAYFAPYRAIDYTALPQNVPIMEWCAVDNLLEGTTFSDGYVSATSGTVTSNSSYTTTDYIEVEGGMYLISSANNTAARWFTVAQYDSDQVVIPGTNERLSSLLLFANAKYIRLTYAKSEMATYVNLVLFQSSVSDYLANHYEVKRENLKRVYDYVDEHAAGDSIVKSPLYGKKVAWYGDSIIKNTWWQNLSTMFDMTSTNCGVGGTKVSGTAAASMCQASRINGQYEDVTDPNTGEVTVGGVAIPLDAEFIIIGAGTNDWAQNVPLGEKNVQYDENWDIVENVTTFYQACHVMFRRLQELRPNAKVIVLGTPFGRMGNRDAFTNKYGILNNQGLSTLDYGNALCDVAEMWGFYAFRYGNNMGINDNNIASLLDPGGDGHLHPTTPAAKEMFRRVTLNCLLTIRYMP